VEQEQYEHEAIGVAECAIMAHHMMWSTMSHFHKLSSLNETVILQNPPQMHRQGEWSALPGP